MIRTETLPHDLLAVASRFMTTGIKLESASPEERIEVASLTRAMVAGMIRAVRAGEDAWEDVHLTPEQLDALELPPDDLRLLELVATRRTTAAIANAASRAMIASQEVAATLGVEDLDLDDAVADEAGAALPEEADATVTGWATFPGKPPGAVDREDGGAVRAEPGDDVPGGR